MLSSGGESNYRGQDRIDIQLTAKKIEIHVEAGGAIMEDGEEAGEVFEGRLENSGRA